MVKAFPAIKDAKTSSLPIIPQVPVINSYMNQFHDSDCHINVLQSHKGVISIETSTTPGFLSWC